MEPCDCHASKTVSQTQTSTQTVSTGVLSQWWTTARRHYDRIRGLLNSEILKELTLLLLEMYLFSFLVVLVRIYLVRTSRRIRVSVTKIKVLFPENYKNCWKELKSTPDSWTGRQHHGVSSPVIHQLAAVSVKVHAFVVTVAACTPTHSGEGRVLRPVSLGCHLFSESLPF